MMIECETRRSIPIRLKGKSIRGNASGYFTYTSEAMNFIKELSEIISKKHFKRYNDNYEVDVQIEFYYATSYHKNIVLESHLVIVALCNTIIFSPNQVGSILMKKIKDEECDGTITKLKINIRRKNEEIPIAF